MEPSPKKDPATVFFSIFALKTREGYNPTEEAAAVRLAPSGSTRTMTQVRLSDKN